MRLLGGHAWYIPRWLDRILPNLTIEASHEPSEAQTEEEEDDALPKAA
jgi:hypothetical protein